MRISIYNVKDEPVGSGGMGEVYLGWDNSGNAVAIKKMRAELTVDATLRTFFHKEVNTLKKLEHQSIVKMYASFEENGNLYLVMEYVEGETIEQYVRRKGAIAVSEAVRLLTDILLAVGYVHQNGYVHRDIKPGNIMIRPDGRVCLLDFGIVKDMKSSSGHTVNQIIGTDGYMSPEQADACHIDARSDIYALGCVLYYMLVGEHAIQKQSSNYATRMTITEKTFPRAKDHNPLLSDHIQQILDKATDKNMLRRFQSCREFELELNGGGTVLDDYDENTVSVGKMNCDVIVANHPKVSRHHADIEYVFDPETIRYKFRDRSTNGTVINGEQLHNGTREISFFDWATDERTPMIFLAGEVELKWEEVEAAFERKSLARQPGTTRPSAPTLMYGCPPADYRPQSEADAEEGEEAVGWLIAIYIFAALGGFLGLIFGMSVYRQKINLPDGRSVYRYKKSHRTAALVGAILSCISIFIWRMAIIN